jgi:hypothetical protein
MWLAVQPDLACSRFGDRQALRGAQFEGFDGFALARVLNCCYDELSQGRDQVLVGGGVFCGCIINGELVVGPDDGCVCGDLGEDCVDDGLHRESILGWE